VFWTQQTQPPSGPVGTQTDSATFDAADRQVKTTDNSLTTSYGYDAAGRERMHTIVDGATGVATTMDSEGREVAISEGLGGSGPYVGRMGYNLNDLPVTMTLPGGVAEGQGYDASSRLVTTTLSGPASLPTTTTLNSAYAYGYNAVNWTTRTTTLSGTDTLVHDAQGRLTSETGPQVVAKGGTYAWTYDTNGNLTSQIGDDGFPVTYTYTQAITPNEVQTMVMGDGQPTAYYGYDVHGDTTAITDGAKLNTHMIYDSQARPVQVTFLDHTTPATLTLAYNPDGLRAEYTLAESGKTTLDERFTYRGGVLGQMNLVQGSLAYTDTYLYTDAGAPYELLRQQNGATNRYWYEVDGRGNVVALTDVNGKVVDRYAYDSWGELTSDDGVNETVPQQLRYAGYWYDEKLSWYWLSVRYYDPEIARFLAPDPSEQDGVRTYAYVGNDPIDATDPSGLCRVTLYFKTLGPSAWDLAVAYHSFIVTSDNNNPFSANRHYFQGDGSGMDSTLHDEHGRESFNDFENPHLLTLDNVPCSRYNTAFSTVERPIEALGYVYSISDNLDCHAYAYTLIHYTNLWYRGRLSHLQEWSDPNQLNLPNDWGARGWGTDLFHYHGNGKRLVS